MTPLFSKLLIANRGEIACRVIRTARRLGIATVAVHSEADANALHVRMADEAVGIGPAPAAESYLVGERIIAAAKATGAEAIHPGYGFLSENPDFVAAVEASGLIFVGPPASAIRAMGLKDAAKRLMEQAGVPVVPGYHGDAQELVVLAGKANEIGYPVLIKARAGGGGKGMRRVDAPAEFKDALASCRREAKAAFGDDRVLVEKYIDTPRHIEVQVFADSHGNAVHLFERDCSAQRRHQKVIEEAPAPGMTDEVRAAMTQAAVTAAKTIGYRGAGTIEFIADGSGPLRPDGFWFMEMNTRLQVEHPVTEAVTGLDLVEWQLRVAAGEALPLAQDGIRLCGHAFEARLYAEDAARGFLPATGTLHHLRFPPIVHGAALRIDTGVEEGDAITPWYDPMIAKVIVAGEDRPTALDGLARALEETEVAGCTVNAGFLAALARDTDFAAGRVDTGLIARKQEDLAAQPAADTSMAARAALAASGLAQPVSPDPWDACQGYGHFGGLAKQVRLSQGGAHEVFTVEPDGRGGATIRFGDGALGMRLPLGDAAGDRRRTGPGSVAVWPGHVTLFERGHAITFDHPDPFAEAADHAGGDRLTAPMPGLVKVAHVEAGATVVKGQPLLVLEAMKMEHTIRAPHDGVVATIVAEGAQVADGAPLVRFEE